MRGSVRATLAAAVPVLSSPIELRLLPLVEVHDDPGSSAPLPSDNWRARVAIEGARRYRAGASVVRLSVAIEHESDHRTARSPGETTPAGFLELNDVAVRALGTVPFRALLLDASLDSRLFVDSCTRIEAPCRDFHGSVTYGGAANLAVRSAAPALLGWQPFLAISASWLAASGDVAGELRAETHLGLFRAGPSGSWQVFLLGYGGNDVGILRAGTVRQAGLGMRWAP